MASVIISVNGQRQTFASQTFLICPEQVPFLLRIKFLDEHSLTREKEQVLQREMGNFSFPLTHCLLWVVQKDSPAGPSSVGTFAVDAKA